MFRTKKWLTVLVALVFLAFTFTPALAGSQPPGNMPPPTDYAPADPAEFTPLPVEPVTVPSIGVDVTYPYPVAPMNNNVYSRTPRFTFTPRAGASQYHLVVVDTMATPDKLVYDFYGTGTCNDLICTMQPANALMTYRFEALKGGTYYWAVEAMVGGLWKGLSSGAYFAVLSSGFNSTFDTDTSKWRAINGTWERTPAGFYKTLGVTNQVASAMQKEFFANDYVYEVTMKRKVEDSYNRIFFQGEPFPLGVDNTWAHSYIFGYYNTGTWALWRYESGTYTELRSGTSPFIRKYGWNTLTVWTDYPYIHMWINGAYLGNVYDNVYDSGFVGVGQYENDSLASALVVNSATLTYSAVAPYAITDVVPGEPLNLPRDGAPD